MDVRLVVADVEGNGRQPPELVELAIVEIENGVAQKEPREWLVRPEKSITSIVSRIHGITNKMVADAPRFSEIARVVREAIDDAYLVGHNVQVDLDVLCRYLPDWAPRGTIDTLRLARSFLPGRKSYSLTSLVADLQLAQGQKHVTGPHRAGYDALVTAELFLRLAHTEHGTPRALSVLTGPPAMESSQGSLF